MIIETKASLKKHLLDLENQIRELKNRLPAHSTKPGMMMELIVLEDERDAVLARIQKPERHFENRNNCWPPDDVV